MHVYAVEMMRDEISTFFVYSHKNVSLTILIENYNHEKIYPELALASTNDYWQTNANFGNKYLTEVVILWDDPNLCEAIDDWVIIQYLIFFVKFEKNYVNILLRLNIKTMRKQKMHYIVFLHHLHHQKWNDGILQNIVNLLLEYLL